MKRMLVERVLALAISLLAGVALAQETISTEDLALQTSRQQHRQQIAQERAHQQALYQAALTTCYQLFAVNDCLREARSQRRAVLDELRRQEIILNELDRQTQARKTMDRIGQKLDSATPSQ